MGLNAASRVLVIVAAGWAAVSPASADDASSPLKMFDSLLEKLDVKAKPADPAPDFVRKTRPDASGLDYIQRPMPHKVSPLPTKTPDEVQAAKDALDAARDRQLNPVKPPVEIGKATVAKPKTVTPAKPPT